MQASFFNFPTIPSIDLQRSRNSHDSYGNVKLGELFCGAGGMALGASQAMHKNWRFEHEWAIDANGDACKTIQQVMNSGNIIKQDVRGLDFNSLSAIEGLVFGFPCNDFSVVGERNGTNGTSGQLYLSAVECLKKLSPMFFVAENVSGLAQTNGNEDYRQILRELEEAGPGYSVTSKLYKFENWKIPQRRHRYIIVGFRRDTNLTFEHPEPDKDWPTATAREALSDIPANAANHAPTMPNQRVQERLSYIQPGANAFSDSIPERLRLNMRSNALISQIYRRLNPDEPAYTVTASGGGGTHLYHWEENRALSNRERARLQTFPDDYIFHGKKESVRKQIGMAVPPAGAKIIFEALIPYIETYRSERQ